MALFIELILPDKKNKLIAATGQIFVEQPCIYCIVG